MVVNNDIKIWSINEVFGRNPLPTQSRVQMTSFSDGKELSFDLLDDGDKSLKAIDLLEDYDNNCYYSYVVKSGIEPGILFINET